MPTCWHLTIGTYSMRLHGGSRPAVDRDHNTLGTPFLKHDWQLERWDRQAMTHSPITLSREQRLFLEGEFPRICTNQRSTPISSERRSDTPRLAIEPASSTEHPA